jgi:hypothetical protein
VTRVSNAEKRSKGAPDPARPFVVMSQRKEGVDDA